ncbi:hypothetical protein TNCV_5118691 [Trichonephila clavipes]|nr:hypothetical protein TNCV_5118691 [Trichonephila clavipes]
MDSWLACHEFEPCVTGDPPCRRSRCTKFRRPPVGVVWNYHKPIVSFLE